MFSATSQVIIGIFNLFKTSDLSYKYYSLIVDTMFCVLDFQVS